MADPSEIKGFFVFKETTKTHKILGGLYVKPITDPVYTSFLHFALQSLDLRVSPFCSWALSVQYIP